MASLEDPNDPNVHARGQRLKRAYQQFMHAASGLRFGGGVQVHMAQNEFLQTQGVTQMASNFVPTDSQDPITLAALQDLFETYGVVPPEPGS